MAHRAGLDGGDPGGEMAPASRRAAVSQSGVMPSESAGTLMSCNTSEHRPPGRRYTSKPRNATSTGRFRHARRPHEDISRRSDAAEPPGEDKRSRSLPSPRATQSGHVGHSPYRACRAGYQAASGVLAESASRPLTGLQPCCQIWFGWPSAPGSEGDETEAVADIGRPAWP